MAHDHPHDDGLHDHDLGLSHDLPKLVERGTMARRGVLALFGGLGAAGLVGLRRPGLRRHHAELERRARGAPGGGPGGAPPPGGGADSSVTVADGEIPEETAGPYPGDGSNGVNVLTETGIVRSDITSSFGNASGVAEGVPLTVRLKVYDLTGEDATALAGAAVYLWHCDRDGQVLDVRRGRSPTRTTCAASRRPTRTARWSSRSIFPAAYAGRWPHIHFEVYPSLDDATSATNKLRTSQLALPRGRLHRGLRDRGLRGHAERAGLGRPPHEGTGTLLRRTTGQHPPVSDRVRRGRRPRAALWTCTAGPGPRCRRGRVRARCRPPSWSRPCGRRRPPRESRRGRRAGATRRPCNASARTSRDAVPDDEGEAGHGVGTSC